MVGYIALPPQRKKSNKRKWFWTLAPFVLAVLSIGVWLALGAKDEEPANRTSASTEAKTEGRQTVPEPPKPPVVDLQPVVDTWLSKQPAEFGIVVYDTANQKVIATHNADKKYFAASLYKLFVAYLSLVDFQNGAQNPEEILSGGFTRKECVDKMIRESHSPCGEAMMADMGQENLRKRVNGIGIKNTIFAGITTTAQDSALILQYIVERKDLNTESTVFLKDAMRVQDQKFRNGLAKGAPDATWETKVGWNLDDNYHDVGIMTLPSGRSYVVAILSLNNGSPGPIADFAATIYQALR